jgi:hypothetical protein
MLYLLNMVIMYTCSSPVQTPSVHARTGLSMMIYDTIYLYETQVPAMGAYPRLRYMVTNIDVTAFSHHSLLSLRRKSLHERDLLSFFYSCLSIHFSDPATMAMAAYGYESNCYGRYESNRYVDHGHGSRQLQCSMIAGTQIYVPAIYGSINLPCSHGLLSCVTLLCCLFFAVVRGIQHRSAQKQTYTVPPPTCARTHTHKPPR